MDATNAGQDLCKNCGFCCDDTLFPHATVKKDEILPPGLEEVSEEGKRHFKLPCPHFDGTCTIYHQGRPLVCATFQCPVLEQYSEGKLSFAEAAQLIAQLKAQKVRMNQLLSTYAGETITDRYNEFQRHHAEKANTVQFKLEHKKLLMEWVLYKTRLEKFGA